MCICITESPCCAPETLYVNYTSIKKYICIEKNSLGETYNMLTKI